MENSLQLCKMYLHKNLLPKKIYNNLFLGNVLEKVSIWNDNYHLVNLIDVLEHWPKPTGLDFINKLLQTGKKILLSVPKLNNFLKEGAYGKSYPALKAQYEESDFDGFNSIELDSKGKPSINKLLVSGK